MTKHAKVEERHRRRVYELSRELVRIMLDGDGSQDTEIAHDAAIAQALADLEAAGRLAGLEEAAVTAVVDDRDVLGRIIREAWMTWAQEQPSPKASWLVPYDELAESDKEADRQIGKAIASHIHKAIRALKEKP